MPFAFLAKLFNRNARDDVSHRIYGTVVAQARKTVLYTDFAVADTVIGRCDMLALHVFLVNHRLKRSALSEKESSTALSQSVFDLFIADIERGLRDIGFADTSVFKRNKRFTHSYYALVAEFDEALEKSDVDQVIPAVADRYFDKMPDAAQHSYARSLATYMVNMAQYLASVPDQVILSGSLDWPQPTLPLEEN